MNWCSLRKYLRYIPRLLWIGCLVGIAFQLLQGKAVQEAHQRLSEQRRQAESAYGKGRVDIQAHPASREGRESLFGTTAFEPEFDELDANPAPEKIENLSEETQSPVEEAAEPPEILEAYRELYEQNNELAGWLTMEGTSIDHPVMQCGDNDYYLHHDFEKEENRYGELFVKAGCPLDGTASNIIIYGHHMKDGSMFAPLKKYEDETFYEEHRRFQFDTLYEQRTYEIIAVFRSQIFEDESTEFKYYQYYGELTADEFDVFYQNIKELSLYDTGIEAQYGDSLLTLSTCSYHTENGRLAVVAKRVYE